jgi:hypothetical protein
MELVLFPQAIDALMVHTPTVAAQLLMHQTVATPSAPLGKLL